MTNLIIVLAAGFLMAGTSYIFLMYAVSSPRFARFRISDDPHRAIDKAALNRSVILNMPFSAIVVVASSLLLSPILFYEHAVPLWRILLEGVTVIFLYDFMYYFVHRYPFHEWKMLRDAHAIHHAAQNPRAIDSFLLHPTETFLGLALLFTSILIVGGIHIWTFAPIFVAYTSLNVFNHAGIALPYFPFKTIGILAIKHDRHHHSMLSGNYASISPLPDYVFGTLE